MKVTVAIPTRKRLDDLRSLLEALRGQEHGPSLSFEVLVVDNDADGSAAGVVAAARTRGMSNITYVVEPLRGISAARNRALSLANGDAIAFIDDDEIPCPKWLACLVDAMAAFQGDIVLGPVLPVYPSGVSKWIVNSGVFERRRLQSGAKVGFRDLRSGNVLLSREWLNAQASPPTFDSRLGLTGGEDVLFFSQALEAGAQAVWCDEAVVRERIPLDRASAGYLLRRWFQAGISICLIAKIRFGRPGMLREFAKGLVLLPVGILVGSMVLPFSVRKAAVWYMKAVCGAGKVAGAFGHDIRLYASEEPGR